MNAPFLPLALALCAALFTATSSAQRLAPTNNAAPPLRWQRGPVQAGLGDLAQLQLPAGYVFLDAQNARVFIEKLGNPTSGREVGVVAPTNLAWIAILQFDPIGYVPDTEKSRLDASAIFGSVLAANSIVNTERSRNGKPPVRITGWETPPAFDPQHARMEWALRSDSGKETSVNLGVRILGRSGVIEASLVERQRLASNRDQFKGLLNGVAFREGERYIDHQPGDKLAPYGLSGLITRGEVKLPSKGMSFLREVNARLQRHWWMLLLFGVAGGWIAGLLVRLRWITRQMDAMAARSAGCQLVETRTPRTTTTNSHPAPAKIKTGKRRPVRMERRFDSYTYYQDLTRDLYRHGR